MYLILDDRAGAPNCGLTYPFAFDRGELRSAPVQRYLENLVEGRHRISCCCTSGGALPLRRRTLETHFCVARPPSAPDQHAPHCHHASGNVGGALGFEPGTLTRSGEGLVLDVGRWLLPPDAPAPSGGSGDWSGEAVDFGRRLRSLLWLLLETSGMNAYHPRLRRRRFLEALFSQAGDIATRRGGRLAGSLADMLLQPAGFDHACRAANTTKLESIVHGTKKRILVLSLLPQGPLSTSVNGKHSYLQLKPQLGVSVNVPERVLKRALKDCQAVAPWRKAGRQVLLLGLATAATFEGRSGPRTVGEVKHMALLPVHERMAPAPTAETSLRLEGAIRKGALYLVSAQEDPAMAQSDA